MKQVRPLTVTLSPAAKCGKISKEGRHWGQNMNFLEGQLKKKDYSFLFLTKPRLIFSETFKCVSMCLFCKIHSHLGWFQTSNGLKRSTLWEHHLSASTHTTCVLFLSNRCSHALDAPLWSYHMYPLTSRPSNKRQEYSSGFSAKSSSKRHACNWTIK